MFFYAKIINRIYFSKLVYNLRKDLSNIGLGVMPDVKITENPNKILNGQDDCIEYFEQE
ncbi:MAG: hypothetical protein KDE33_11100 [Bacteroidetes bacterium]|nr:hypothetical protein [Bacteroidota bacterium]